MEKWRVKLTARGKKLKERNLPWRCAVTITICDEITMMALNHILRKYTGGYKLHKSQEKINHRMFMDDIKLFAKNEKEFKTLI